MVDTIIIGGGLSGLSLAQKLESLGVDWQLFEARDRFGGRIHTRIDPDGAAHDLGPAWIWPHQERILRLIDELGLRTHGQYSKGALVFEDEKGHVRRDLNFSTMAGTLRVVGGLGAVTQALVEKLSPERLHLNTPVKGICADADGFAVSIGETDAPSVYAKRIVIALPPRLVAQSIKFGSLLGDDVREAMKSVPTWMAGHGKIIVAYSEPFWRNQGWSGDAISHRGPMMEIHDASGERPDSPGALFGFVHPGVVAQAPDEDLLRNAARQQLETLFGEAATHPTAIHIKMWLQDPFTATSDDAVTHDHPPGGVPAALAALEDKGIFFNVSELASEDPGLVEGALAVTEETVRRLV